MAQLPTHRARRILDAAGHAFPGVWDAFARVRQVAGVRLPAIPATAFVPLGISYPLLDSLRSKGYDESVPVILTMLGAWRMTQGIYRFDPVILDALLATPITGRLPTELLDRLPEWCVYLETPFLTAHGSDVRGVWAMVDRDSSLGDQLLVLFDYARDPRRPGWHDDVLLVPLPLADSFERSVALLDEGLAGGTSANLDRTDLFAFVRATLPSVLSMLLYLCADADLDRDGRQVSLPSDRSTLPRPQRSADAPVLWDVGTRMGAALRRAGYGPSSALPARPGAARSVRPHVRRAHWHTFLSGARQVDGVPVAPADRKRDLRWVPPIAVNLPDAGALAATVRPVRPG